MHEHRYAVPAGTDWTQWHTYGLLWTPPANGGPGKVTWYFDNQPVGSQATTQFPGSVFDQQKYFLVLTMQNGKWGKCAPATDGSAPSMSMSVQWVRVWQ